VTILLRKFQRPRPCPFIAARYACDPFGKQQGIYRQKSTVWEALLCPSGGRKIELIDMYKQTSV